MTVPHLLWSKLLQNGGSGTVQQGVGDPDGAPVGLSEGFSVGDSVGFEEGEAEGNAVGLIVSHRPHIFGHVDAIPKPLLEHTVVTL